MRSNCHPDALGRAGRTGPRHPPGVRNTSGCLNQYGRTPTSKACPSDVKPQPFITLPTSCAGPLSEEATADSWQHPGYFFRRRRRNAAGPRLQPALLRTDDRSPPEHRRGRLPRRAERRPPRPPGPQLRRPPQPHEPATAELKEAKVALPRGITVNPSSANGLGACSAAQIGLRSVADERQRITLPRPAARPSRSNSKATPPRRCPPWPPPPKCRPPSKPCPASAPATSRSAPSTTVSTSSSAAPSPVNPSPSSAARSRPTRCAASPSPARPASGQFTLGFGGKITPSHLCRRPFLRD